MTMFLILTPFGFYGTFPHGGMTFHALECHAETYFSRQSAEQAIRTLGIADSAEVVVR